MRGSVPLAPPGARREAMRGDGVNGVAGAAAAPEHELLLLGLLRQESRHGYSLVDFIERNAGEIVGLSKATAYQVLRRLEHRGDVVAGSERVGNRPPRRVFSITPAGEARFLSLLRAALGTDEAPRYGSDVGLMFMDQLPPGEVAAALRQRLLQARERAEQLALTHHESHAGVDWALDHMRAHLETEIRWLGALLGSVDKSENAGG